MSYKSKLKKSTEAYELKKALELEKSRNKYLQDELTAASEVIKKLLIEAEKDTNDEEETNISG